MAIIKNITKLIVPAYGKGSKDVITYINEQAWSAGTDVGTISLNGEFYSVMGSQGLVPEMLLLQATINATATSIPVTNSPTGSVNSLSAIAPTGYVLIEDEVIQYTSITPAGSSVSGYDELTLTSSALRGVKGTTAATHTVGIIPITEILFGTVSNIEYNKNTEVFNVWTQTTQRVYQGYVSQSSTVTTHLIPCPDNTVTFFEVDGVAS